MRLPMASVRTCMPAWRIHEPTSAFARRIAGEQKVRIRLCGSSLILASASIRSITIGARSVRSPFTLASPVSAIGPGGDKKGNVVGHVRVGNSESDRDAIQKAEL